LETLPNIIFSPAEVELYPVVKYIKYQLFSSPGKGHGIHSPFVFDLVDRVFRNKNTPVVVFNIEQLRKRLTSNNREISVKDMGSGSKRMKSNLRKISSIAKYSSVPARYGRLLASLAGEFGGSGTLELGTSLGISTMYLAAGQKEGKVYTIEGCPETLSAARENFSSCGFEGITAYCGSFDEMIPRFGEENITAGLVFIDGDHRKESVLRYYEKVKQFTDSRSVIVLDDIHVSKGMGEAWEHIKNDPGISVTVDLYRFGLVFFRKGMTRADYEIRY
jgi:predicted O-methyltransferase YrrM